MGVLEKVKNTLSDHPNASADPKVNPSKGIQQVNDYDPNMSNVQNRIQAGQGGFHPDEQKFRAGNVTSEDATSSAKGHPVAGTSILR